MTKIATAERVSRDASDNFVFQRSLLAYHAAAEHISGQVLEIGTGTGYGVEVIAPHADLFITIDKHATERPSAPPQNVVYLQTTVPLLPLESNSFDYVISFQVIEHIKEDVEFIREIHRVLRPGGTLILTTPNAPMSLTRNPWHEREYTADQLTNLLSCYFPKIEALGIFGNEKVMAYYAKNQCNVKRLMRFDILNLQHRLPRRILQIPYDIMNRLNRRVLLKANDDLTRSITMADYSINPIDDDAFDLLYIVQK